MPRHAASRVPHSRQIATTQPSGANSTLEPARDLSDRPISQDIDRVRRTAAHVEQHRPGVRRFQEKVVVADPAQRGKWIRTRATAPVEGACSPNLK